jgi:hypothetical protein
MIKVKKLCVLWTSYEGGKKLIPKDEYQEFIKDLRKAELLFENEVLYTAWEDRNPERELELQQDVYDLIDKYDTLEGEQVFVVLPEDIIEGEED